jgi:hypothetical protein
MHEHVFILSPEITDNYPAVWGDEAKREADAIARLNELKSRGVDSIVDLTVIGPGRYIAHRGGHRHQHRGGDRCLHVQRRADVLPLHRSGARTRRRRADG